MTQTRSAAYDGPAGVVLSRDDARLVLDLLTQHVDTMPSLEQLVSRFERYLASDWEARAAARSRAIEQAAGA